MSEIYLDNIAKFLDYFLAVDRFSEAERGGVYLPSKRPIKRFGLALEPSADLSQWVEKQKLDGLFLHRPWKLQPGQIAEDIGIVTYHLAFDECMTLGFNPRLASVLTISQLEVLGEKEGRPIGTIGEIPPRDFASYYNCINEVFGGVEAVRAGARDRVRRVAVVGAMTDMLVREAAARGADLYLTGQLRQPGLIAGEETGINLVAVGHRRSEEWGLRSLAGVLRERWCKLEPINQTVGE